MNDREKAATIAKLITPVETEEVGDDVTSRIIEVEFLSHNGVRVSVTHYNSEMWQVTPTEGFPHILTSYPQFGRYAEACEHAVHLVRKGAEARAIIDAALAQAEALLRDSEGEAMEGADA